MIDEGYTKYAVRWSDRETLARPEIAELERWRRPLFEAGLVGHYPEQGIGYGNISVRTGCREFLVSGTQTGHLPRTGPAHYALVVAYDIDGNTVTCRGAVQASSEALTHAALYELDAAIGAVVHVHDPALWRRLLDGSPATREDVAYGTPEMARELGRLYRETPFAHQRLAAMAGHESGIVAIGATLREAAERVLAARHALADRPEEKTA
ncbi:MAG TPA: class II aldolase/adducin family protein [Woeseiaceae bacterium]|nr:class II aldolase/adducin family protein [Woeseiaceae bacterium]